MRPVMEEFQEHLSNQNKLKAHQIEFEKMVRHQLILISNMKNYAMSVKFMEQAAMYSDMEKDFEDLLKLIIKK